MYLQKNKELSSLRIFLNTFYVFIFFRILASFAIYLFLKEYDSRFLSFTDLDFYNSAEGLNIFSPNYFYSKLVSTIGYSSNTMQDNIFIFFSSIVSIIFVFPYVLISTKVLNKKSRYLFNILLASHPYVVLYSLKLDSSLFPLFAISIFNFYLFFKNTKNYILLIIASTLCLFLRNSLLPFSILIYILLFLEKNNFSKIHKYFIFGSLICTTFMLLSQIGYGIEFVNQNFGCFSFENISEFFNQYFGINFSKFISLITTPLIHLGLNLGAREAISLYCFDLPVEIASSSFVNLFSTLGFFLFHTFLLIKLIFWIKKNFSLKNLIILIPFSILLPTLYGAAHMRYLLPLIPMLLLWQFIPEREKTNFSYLESQKNT